MDLVGMNLTGGANGVQAWLQARDSLQEATKRDSGRWKVLVERATRANNALSCVNLFHALQCVCSLFYLQHFNNRPPVVSNVLVELILASTRAKQRQALLLLV